MNLEMNHVEIEPILIFEKVTQFKTILYSILLMEVDSDREILIDIGDMEATLIFLNMNSDLFPSIKPDTHDLLIESLTKFNIEIMGGFVSDQSGLEWNATLELFNKTTRETIYLDVRPSDLICICLKLNLPIYANESLITKQIINKLKPTKTENESDKLKRLLQKAIDTENYEEAAIIKNQMDNL